ncbi:MAG: hypothetical protein U0L49_05115 [Eubacterium sp.]|nr:hypothetical protein [Eubacterium sp.]
MASYDYSYISMLLHDMNRNDSTAYAAFYAATCQSIYKFMVSRLGSSYQAQDAMQKLYVDIFRTDSYPERTPRAFISYFEKNADRIASEMKQETSASEEDRSAASGSEEVSSSGPVSEEGTSAGPVSEEGTSTGPVSEEGTSAGSVPEKGSTASVFDAQDSPDQSEKASPVFDMKDADLMLSYIFQAAHMDRGEYPFETLLSYSNYRIRRRNLQKILLVIIIIIGALIPTILIQPKLDLQTTGQVTSNGHKVYHAEVSSLYPVDSINASMQNKLMPVTVNPDGTYLIYPLASGSMTVKVTLMTSKSITVTIAVE